MSKKLLAVILAFALVFSTFTAAFAAEALPADAQAAVTLGMLKGDTSAGVTSQYLVTAPTRLQSAILFLRLKGLENEALAYTSAVNFSDANTEKWQGGRNIMAYLKNHPELGWKGDHNKFSPEDKIIAQDYYKVMLEALGYKQTDADTIGDFTYDQTIQFAAAQGLTKVAGVTNFTVADVATATLEALKANVKGATKTLAASLVEAGILDSQAAIAAGVVPAPVTLAVNSIVAGSAKSFKVTFNSAVADTSKVAFEVKRSTTPVTVTTTWNDAKTEATLTSASNFAEATFTVVVKQDDKELASQNITINAQKVAKVEFTSKNVSVNLSNGQGFVTYKVFDQYNNDITSNYLANNLTWQTGVGTIAAKNGLATITPGATPLMQYQNLSVIAYDTNSGISATVTLPTATSMGTLSDFALGSVNNIKLVDGDVTSVYYIPFTAKDMSGNETKDYNLIMGGLILKNTNELVVSLGSNVSAKVVQDPVDSRNAAIELKVLNGTPVVMDMPVTITAMTYTGKTSSVQTTLAKAKEINSITLLAPSATVAAGETPEIAFEAYDQYGNKITKYSEINNKVTPTGFSIQKKVNGDAKFVMTSVGSKGVATLSAVVNATGKMSTLNINVQDAAVPSRIAIDNTVLVAAMENGATQDIGLVGSTPTGLKIYDQYDREMTSSKISTAFNSGNAYKVVATNTTAQVNLSATDLTSGTGSITLTANAANGGADTVKFSLVDVVNNKVLGTVAASLTVVKTSDITGYTINTFDTPIYAANGSTAQEQEYAANVEVFGKTNAGAKVLLAGTPIVSTSVENTTDFSVVTGSGAYDAVTIAANALTAARPTAKTVVTVNLFHNKTVTSLTTNLESSYTAPVATAIASRGTTEDKITLTKANFDALANKDVVLYDVTGADATTAAFYFKVTDSYGTYAMIPAQFIVDAQNASGNAGTSTLTIDANGHITAATGTAGDVVYVTAITNNGLVKTVQVTVTP